MELVELISKELKDAYDHKKTSRKEKVKKSHKMKDIFHVKKITA